LVSSSALRFASAASWAALASASPGLAAAASRSADTRCFLALGGERRARLRQIESPAELWR